MEFFEVLEKRHSVRRFEKKEIEKEKLEKILEAANSAPSAGDLQAYEIVIVRDEKRKRELSDAALGQSSVANAPLVLVFLADAERSSSKYGRRGAELYSIQDATIACAYAQLACTALHLGCVWIGAFEEKEIARILNAPENVRPVALLPIGYPAEKPYKTPRREISELVREEEY